MSGGRPSKYDPAFCELVIALGTEGAGKCEMSADLAIHYTTFEAWQVEHKEFSEAVKQALRLSQAWWERKGREATFGAFDGYNATSYIFQMKNRFREDWRDKSEVENNGAVTVTIQRFGE